MDETKNAGSERPATQGIYENLRNLRNISDGWRNPAGFPFEKLAAICYAHRENKKKKKNGNHI